jgi:hypothetical protein
VVPRSFGNRKSGHLAANGVISSAFIAFFAYQIDIKVQDNAVKEARISRSVALAQSLFNDDVVKEAILLTNRIEMEAASIFEEEIASQDRNYKSAQIRAIQNMIDEDEEHFLAKMMLVTQHIRRARNCIEAVDGHQKRLSTDSLCDSETYINLVGEMVSDLWWHIRPILTCDDRIYSKQQIDDFRTMIRVILENSNDDNTPIYDTIGDAGRDNAEEGHVVIEFDTNFCREYDRTLARMYQEAAPAEGSPNLTESGADARHKV